MVAFFYRTKKMGRKKLAKEEFFNRVRNPNYIINKDEFVDLYTKINVMCIEHGLFQILPCNMLYKNEGCKFCGIEKMAKTKSLTRQEFIKKAKKIHGDKYDYSLVDYVNNKTKVIIICKNCGLKFMQEPRNHLNGQGCPNCFRKQRQYQDSQDSLFEPINLQ